MAPQGSVATAEVRATPDLHADHPEAYIARDRRRALAAGTDLPDRVSGSALFADISGFTPLTEALAAELGAQRGAEELTANIGRIFHAVIDELDAFGGDVIYFSGDAITCWIDGDDGLAAATAGLAMLEAIQRTGLIVTPGGTSIQLAMKVAIAVGNARRFVVGDPDVQLVDVLAGRLIDDLAAAEHFANKGEVILEPSAAARLDRRAILGERRTDEERGREYAVLAGLTELAERREVVEPPPLPEELVRPWLLPAVYERLRTGRGEFLTELRPAIPVFVRFAGIDYDADDDAAGKLDELIRGAQRVLSGYGGNLLQLTLGDKGAYLYGVFGSPIAHEDDEARAAAAALELRDLEKTTAARDIQVGVTRGVLRSGTYGHAMRRTFVCLGDEVNLSARLMSAAPPGRIYVSERIRQGAGDAYIWERLPDMRVKGKSEPVAVFSLNGSLERASRRKTRFELRLVGRRHELATLHARLADANAGHGRILGIAAEAGMGKSRLVAEFVRAARRSGYLVAFGECQAFGSSTPYFAFREVWRRLLLLEDEDAERKQIAALGEQLERIDPALVGRAPLLGGLLGLTIPDNELTQSFDAKLRKASLEDLLATCLTGRARDEPIVIVLEDCHWIDELSRDLLHVLASSISTLRVLFVLAYRPTATPGGGLGIERFNDFAEIELARLDDEEAAAVVRSKLTQVLGRNVKAAEELAHLVSTRAEGNPLYIEELISFIAARGIDPADPVALRNLQLPDSLQSIVLSRIDTVAESPRRTMKVASVIGRVFQAPLLPGAYEELGSLDDVRGQLEELRIADLVGLDREEDLSYLFKHVVTQEVAYESMPFSLRTVLHRRLASYIESSDPSAVDRNLDLLAHHYWRGDDEAKKREFLNRAGLAAQAQFSNAAAVDYFERLLPLLDPSPRIEATLNLAKVLQHVGSLARAEAVVVEARAMAAAEGEQNKVAWCDASLAETARRQSHYEETTARLEAALAVFRATRDTLGEATMLHLAGVVAQHGGDYAKARARYAESRTLRETLGDRAGVAATDANLAILAEFEGDYEGAFDLNERSLELRREIGDRRGIGIGEMNAGYYGLLLHRTEESLARLEIALGISREIGDRAMISHSLRTLADGYRNAGSFERAAEFYEQAIQMYRELGNAFELAFLLEDVAVLISLALGGSLPLELLGAAEALRAKVGSPRPPALQEELEHKLVENRSAIGETEAQAALERGRLFTLETALLMVEDAFAVLGRNGTNGTSPVGLASAGRSASARTDPERTRRGSARNDSSGPST